MDDVFMLSEGRSKAGLLERDSKGEIIMEGKDYQESTMYQNELLSMTMTMTMTMTMMKTTRWFLKQMSHVRFYDASITDHLYLLRIQIPCPDSILYRSLLAIVLLARSFYHLFLHEDNIFKKR